MPVRRCTVSFTDACGCRHETEVFAETVFEAAAVGIRAVREQEVLDDDSALDVCVEVHTTTRHRVAWAKVLRWLESNTPDPKQQARKARLRGA